MPDDLHAVFRKYLNINEQLDLKHKLRRIQDARDEARHFMRLAKRLKDRARKRAEVDARR